MNKKILVFDSKDKKIKRMRMIFRNPTDYEMFCFKYQIGIFEYCDGSEAIICFK